ncbi:MAG: hypothetical protein IKT74_01255, partial [Bacteroidales bacterium]|nr:hypothetical protein [Bacteroidales bacterium]
VKEISYTLHNERNQDIAVIGVYNQNGSYKKSLVVWPQTNPKAETVEIRTSKPSPDQVIIRWMIDSDPQGARIFYRVISSIPDEVKNTNESYMLTTPFEETRAFNILGLTYENSMNVQVEIKLMKSGYYSQVKRFNLRQALDQQEISAFFNLVPKEETEQ